MDGYILIHGSDDDDVSEKTMEIFNGTSNEVVTDSLSWNMDKLNVSGYSWTLYDDLFVVTGGIEIDSGHASQSVQYLNVSQLFTIPAPNSTFIWEYPCITKYDALNNNLWLDEYLVQEQEVRYTYLYLLFY